VADSLRVGILGGGQLAWLLAIAAERLGIACRALDPSPEAPAGRVCELIQAPYDDLDGLTRLAAGCDVVTYEFENVPVAAPERLAELGAILRPDPRALAVSQDRLEEKRLFGSLGIATAPYERVDSSEAAEAAIEHLGPSILKTRRLGYDGKGQVRITRTEEASSAFESLGGVPCIAEGLVAFDTELSIIATRSPRGSMRVYPVSENRHREGILRRTDAPARVSSAIAQEAVGLAEAVLSDLDYVGTMAIELFLTGRTLVANEIAPRVHNSGHWTIEGAETSQFENHLRAICDLPLGSAALRAPSTMMNVIGSWPARASLLRVPGAAVHDYGKAERSGRKLGHVTVTAADAAAVSSRVRALESLLV
jgi:5-(carboxyamino)imidazole ribonucleotide synthase